MPRHFPMSVSDNPRPRGPIRPTNVRWRANGTTPPILLRPMPDRVPPARGWIEVAALVAILLIVGDHRRRPCGGASDGERSATMGQRPVDDAATVLLTAVRGPDGIPKYGPTKMVLRWYRRCILLSAMDREVLPTPYHSGGGSFTGPSFDALYGTDWTIGMGEVVGEYLREIDAIPHHFQLHLLHAIQIVGYKHPDDEIRGWWAQTYERLVHDMHLWPETEAQMDYRLGDDRDQWLARNDIATVD